MELKWISGIYNMCKNVVMYQGYLNHNVWLVT